MIAVGRRQAAGVNLTRALLVPLLAVAIGPKATMAQSTLRGRVVDSEVGSPLTGATVRIRKDSPPLITGATGEFEAHQLPAGDAEVTITSLGYAPGVFKMHLPALGAVDRVFALDFDGHQLPEVIVQARAQELMPRYVDFERRRQRRLGAYFRWEELKKGGYGSVGDALRTVRGVRIKCSQETFECFAFMARTPQCQPAWWIDGVEVGSFHENTPIPDIYGIEIYRGPGEVPGEFSGSTAGCGVIVVWTKSRPFR